MSTSTVRQAQETLSLGEFEAEWLENDVLDIPTITTTFLSSTTVSVETSSVIYDEDLVVPASLDSSVIPNSTVSLISSTVSATPTRKPLFSLEDLNLGFYNRPLRNTELKEEDFEEEGDDILDVDPSQGFKQSWWEPTHGLNPDSMGTKLEPEKDKEKGIKVPTLFDEDNKEEIEEKKPRLPELKPDIMVGSPKDDHKKRVVKAGPAVFPDMQPPVMDEKEVEQLVEALETQPLKKGREPLPKKPKKGVDNSGKAGTPPEPVSDPISEPMDDGNDDSGVGLDDMDDSMRGTSDEDEFIPVNSMTKLSIPILYLVSLLVVCNF